MSKKNVDTITNMPSFTRFGITRTRKMKEKTVLRSFLLCSVFVLQDKLEGYLGESQVQKNLNSVSSTKYKNISPVWEKKRRKRGKEERRGGDAINIATILKHAKLWNFFSDGIKVTAGFCIGTNSRRSSSSVLWRYTNHSVPSRAVGLCGCGHSGTRICTFIR